MKNCFTPSDCSQNDFTGHKAAWFLWYAPIAILVVGESWARGRVWLWVPALVVMGLGCLVNAARCRRLHCYVTGPLYLGAALYVVLSAFGLVVLRPGLFLIVVLGVSCLAQCAEIPLGKYWKRT
jgi:hypothetical protein